MSSKSMPPPQCPITGETMTPIFSATLLGKYEVQYFHCERSGIIQTEKPYWLEEAYQSAISKLDTGLVQRNVWHQKQVSWLLELLGIGSGRFLDLGGGYGMLARLMRDAGYDYFTTDPYCANLFAADHQPHDGFTADALTAFEVMEHIENPYEFLSDAFSKYHCNTVIFSTQTYGDSIPAMDWWYWVLESGQHITIYQKRTLRLLADKLGVQYRSIGGGLHLFTDHKMGSLSKIVIDRPLAKALYGWKVRMLNRRKSLVWADYRAAKARLKAPI